MIFDDEKLSLKNKPVKGWIKRSMLAICLFQIAHKPW